ncbi:ATP-binding protein [Micromonospora chokoriensis]|uniref:Regulatory protein, luxR family n=1 Tax=Micromonospora chokoriensis TaxID=356851 RepID=A0A1C4YQ67_9ACTN|nr:AAA family ATPase [Micromonospora chokoriensis]SCF22481.1 regulatory protein, luxR family [Micromonospora chokoriensis]
MLISADSSTRLIGRTAELAVLNGAVERLRGGTGTVVWVEGEPGIGKSAVVAAAAQIGREWGCQASVGVADQLAHPPLLGVFLDCLEIGRRSADPRRARIAAFLSDRRATLDLADATRTAAAVEMVVALVDELCAAGPTMLVVDDVQWADDASLDVCRRLVPVAAHLPLLLVMSYRPGAHGSTVRRLRDVTRRRDVVRVPLGPLPPDAVRDLLAALVGVPPGDGLVTLASQAVGNPLFLQELVGALVREDLLDISTRAEVRESRTGVVPRSLAAALDDRLSFVPAGTIELMRASALLGGEFAVTELAALLGRTAIDLCADLHEAVTAGILVEAGPRMRFRHPLLRQALLDGMPAALRAALHLDVARALEAARVEPQRVAQHLLTSGVVGDRWARQWLADVAPVLAAWAPHLAAELLRREVDHDPGDEHERSGLTMNLARVLLATGDHEEAAKRVRQALGAIVDPGDRGHLHWILARALFSGGHNDAAVANLHRALRADDLPDPWRARLLASLAMFQRAGVGDLTAADATARGALRTAAVAGDAFATAYALTGLWAGHSVRRQHRLALKSVEQAIETLGTGVDHVDLMAFVLHGRIFSLQNLSRWTDAEAALRDARDVLRAANRIDDTTSGVTAAVLLFWLGRWDDALAELNAVAQSTSSATYRGLREGGPGWLRHGVAALIAGHRGERGRAAAHLRAGFDRPLVTVADRENIDFLLVARSVAAEQDGNLRAALDHLNDLLERRPGEMTLTHQWLPRFVRLALAADDRSAAEAGVRACLTEAAAEQVPARATAAADRCRGLYHADAAAIRSAVAHYRASGVPVELAGTLEDLAVVLAERDDSAPARAALDEAIDLYDGFGAAWDVRRAEARLRSRGIRRGVRGSRAKRAGHGWDALTPTERKVATLVAAGRSTPEIAQSLFLTRRTAQTHISRILAKLDLRSRVEIAGVVLRQAPGGVLDS